MSISTAPIAKWFQRFGEPRRRFEALTTQLEGLSAQLEQSLQRERLFREDFSHRLMHEVEARIAAHSRQSFAMALPAGAPIFTHTIDGHRVLLDPTEPFITYHVLEHGEWEKPLRALLSTLLLPGDTYVDVGANIGLHVLLASTLVGETGRIIALEPHPIIAGFLYKNLEINGLLERVTCIRAAACAEHGGIRTFEYFPQHSAMSGFSIDKTRIKLFQGSAEKIDVSTVTLDGIFLENEVKPDLIKIDVEGFELEVLSGCLEALKDSNTAFLMEFGADTLESVSGLSTPNDIFLLMKNNGFSPFGLFEGGLRAVETLDQARSFGDLLFVKMVSDKYERIRSMVRTSWEYPIQDNRR